MQHHVWAAGGARLSAHALAEAWRSFDTSQAQVGRVPLQADFGRNIEHCQNILKSSRQQLKH
eukprot:5801482-Pyramimonas_sp.AAC.1